MQLRHSYHLHRVERVRYIACVLFGPPSLFELVELTLSPNFTPIQPISITQTTQSTPTSLTNNRNNDHARLSSVLDITMCDVIDRCWR